MEGLEKRERKKKNQNQKDQIKTFEMCKNANIVSILFLTEWQPDRQIFSKLKYFFNFVGRNGSTPSVSPPFSNVRVAKFWKWQSFAKFLFYPSVFIILLQLKYAAVWQRPVTKK